METPIIITLTNFGYRELTLNLIKSLKKLNLDIIVYCADQLSYEYFKNYNSKLIDPNINFSNVELFRVGNWGKFVSLKFKIIKENLDNDRTTIFVDGDIVFLKNPIKYLMNKINNNDILVQHDAMCNNNKLLCEYKYGEVCSGFMIIKPTDKTKDFFDLDKIDMNKFKCDQIYINDNINKLQYELLSLDLFPNRFYYYSQKKNNNNLEEHCYIIHFNCCYFKDKKKIMIRYNKYFA